MRCHIKISIIFVMLKLFAFQNLNSTLKKVANFLGKQLGEEDFKKLENHLNIDNFRKNTAVNYSELRELGILIDGEQGFVRNGKICSWKGNFDDELEKAADKWVEENLKGTDIRFPK